MLSGKGLSLGEVRPHILLAVAMSWLVLASQAQQTPNTAPAAAPQAASPTQMATPQAPAPAGFDNESAPAKPADTSADSSLIKLGSGDLVEVSVYGVPELATKTRINNSGDLYLPLVDYVHVEDLTIEEAQKLVEKRMEDGGFVRNPHVTIFVDEYASQGATVLGQVARPAVYPVLGDRKLFDMLTAAGGLTDKAGRTVTITHRTEPDQPETVELARNLTDKPESNVPIRPGDSIEVHRAPLVYIVGDVGRPSGLLVDNGSITVLQALALAGGTNRTAKMNGTRIIRKVGVDGVSETPVPLKKMLQAKAPDIPLQANDILFVPVSGTKVMVTRSFEAAMAITTSLAIYAVHP